MAPSPFPPCPSRVESWDSCRFEEFFGGEEVGEMEDGLGNKPVEKSI